MWETLVGKYIYIRELANLNQPKGEIVANELHVQLQLSTKGSNLWVKHWLMAFYSPNLSIFPHQIFPVCGIS